MMKKVVTEFFTKKTVSIELKDGIVRVKGAKKVKKLFNRSLDKKETTPEIIAGLGLEPGLNDVKVKKIVKYIDGVA